jgi:hypothetical protein
VDDDILLRNRFNRHLQFMANNMDKYYENAKKKHLCLNVDVWKNERMYWGYDRDEYYNVAVNEGYAKAPQDKILTILHDVIKAF